MSRSYCSSCYDDVDLADVRGHASYLACHVVTMSGDGHGDEPTFLRCETDAIACACGGRAFFVCAPGFAEEEAADMTAGLVLGEFDEI